MKRSLSATLAIFLLTTFSFAALASEAPRDNVFNISVTENRSIANDRMIVLLSASQESIDASFAGNEVNKAMTWALEQVEKFEDVEKQTLKYQTHPVYNKQKIQSWRVSQQLKISSENFKELSKLVGLLQGRLLVSSMNFQVSNQAQQKEQDALIVAALEKFKNRADLIQQTMNAKSYVIINASVSTGNSYPPVAMRLESRASYAMDATPPVVESGNSEISVTVNGSIQLMN